MGRFRGTERKRERRKYDSSALYYSFLSSFLFLWMQETIYSLSFVSLSLTINHCSAMPTFLNENGKETRCGESIYGPWQTHFHRLLRPTSLGLSKAPLFLVLHISSSYILFSSAPFMYSTLLSSFISFPATNV